MIETYLIEEGGKLIAEPEEMEKWKELVTKLEMKGQLDCVGGGEGNPIPFEVMNKSEHNIYHTILPDKINYKHYSTSAIPLRVLSLIALAQQEQYFDNIQIWHNETAPDPLVVGIKGSDWNGNFYKIARWGDTLKSLPELRAEAKKIMMDKKRSYYESRLNGLEANTENYLNGDYQEP